MLVLGILNATPDSFSDGGRFLDPARAVARGLEMASEGADALDIGGESTRPGARPVPEAEERARVLPVIEGLRKTCGLPLSIDTRRASVARAALAAGASVVNDVTALRDPAMRVAVREAGAEAVLMHMLGEPGTMQEDPRYRDVVADVRDVLISRAHQAEADGILRSRLILDPGIGFGKTLEHNTEILRRLEEFRSLGRPIVVGASRKSFIGRILGGKDSPLPPEERLEGSLAVACRAALAGSAVLRVHDVLVTRRALEVFSAIHSREIAARRP